MNWPVGHAVQVVRPGMHSGKLDVTNDVHGSVMLHTSGLAPVPPTMVHLKRYIDGVNPAATKVYRQFLYVCSGWLSGKSLSSPSPPQPASMSTAAQARMPVAARATRPQLETAFGIAPSPAVRLALRKVTACKALPLGKKSYCQMERRGASLAS